jgi:hypothetical protein
LRIIGLICAVIPAFVEMMYPSNGHKQRFFATPFPIKLGGSKALIVAVYCSGFNLSLHGTYFKE